MRTAIYTRVSSEEQATEGYSLDAQLHRLRAYCESQGWTVADIYTDEGISAKDMERPELQRMLTDIRDKKIEVVLVHKLDRLTRSVRDLYEMLNVFDRYNVGFKSATEDFNTTTATGRMFITLVSALAQWERETIGERVHFGQAQMVREGRYFGHTPPYGYTLQNGQLFVNPTEAHAVREMFDQYISGSGTSRVVKYMNDRTNNIPRPRGAELWSLKVINTMLKNPVYCGYVRYGNKSKGPGKEMVVAKSDHEPIVSEETFNRAQQLLTQRRNAPPRSGTGIHPLVGVLRCGMCGGAMIGRTERAGRSGRVTDYHGYMCNARRHKRTCTMKMWKRETLEANVIAEIKRKAEEQIREMSIQLPDEDDGDREIRVIEQQLQTLKARRKKWTDAFNQNHITSQDLGEQFRLITAEETALIARLESLSSNQKNATVQLEQLRDFDKTWEIANTIERKELIRDVVETIWVYQDGSVRVDLIV